MKPRSKRATKMSLEKTGSLTEILFMDQILSVSLGFLSLKYYCKRHSSTSIWTGLFH